MRSGSARYRNFPGSGIGALRYTLLVSAGLCGGVLVPASAHAQVSQQGSQAADTGNEEIVVTAQKREQNLNDVGLSVVALSGDTLKTRGVSSLADVANTVPSLSYTNSANNTPVYTLRGVGFYDTSLSSYPTVSIYLDEVPLPFPALTRHSAFDLQRVEVLKGPQGTLFGQNATGGAINYVAAKPTNEFAAGLLLGYGRFDMIQAEGYVSGPLGENVRARLSGRIEHGGDWQKSNSRPGDSVGKTRNYMGRVILEADPTETLKLSLNINGWKDKSDTQAPQKIGYESQSGVPIPPVIAEPFSPETPRAADWNPGFPFADNSMWQAAFRASLEVADDVTLTSLTSYIDYKQKQGEDSDGSFLSTSDIPIDNGRIKSFTQELRLSNGGRGRVRWVVGANLERSTVDQVNLLDYSSGSTHEATIPTGFNVGRNEFSTFQKMRNYAGFGNIEFDVGQFTLKAGGRYTEAKRRTRSCVYDTLVGGTGSFFYGIILGGGFGPYVPGACFAVNTTVAGGPAVDYLPLLAPGEFRGTLKENNVSYRFGVDWKPNSDTLVYANVAKGYKAGGFPTVTAATLEQFFPVKEESLLSYEAGFKLTMFDRVLQLNGAGFYYDYTNKQVRSKLIDPIFGVVEVIQNIPKSSVKGFELEATLRPTRGLVISGAFVFLDAQIDKFVGINAAGVAADFKGTRVPFTPKYQFGLNADYEFPLSGSLRGNIGSSVNYRSSTVSIVGGDLPPPGATPSGKKLLGIDSYALVDVRAGLSSGPWRVQLWGKNIFNKYYWNNIIRGTDLYARYAGMPATYGVTVGWQFK
jgi:outer membrane receptor protein involved in Fe transport